MEETKTSETTNDYTPVKNVLWDLFFIGGACFIYYYLNKAEQESGSVRLPLILALAYKFLSKYVNSWIVGLMGVFALYSGISDYFKEKKNKDAQ